MLDTILFWIYTVLNWFRSPLRQIPTQTTEASMEPQQREGQHAATDEGVTTTRDYEGDLLGRRLPGGLAADKDEDIHLDDPPKQVPDPILSVGGPSVAGGLPDIISTTPGPAIPDDDTAMKLEMPADPATLAARSEELNKDDHDGVNEHAVAPPPSAAAIDLPGSAVEIVKAPPGPTIVPEELASKLELGQSSGKDDDGSGKGGGGQDMEKAKEKEKETRTETEHEM